MTRRARTRLLACSVLGALLGLFSNPLRADAVLSVSIPAQPVDGALAQFAHQTGLQLVYESHVTQARASQGAHSGVSASAALTELLAGTGLGFQFLNNRTVQIFESAAAPAALPQAASAAKPHHGSHVPGLGRTGDEVTVTALRVAGDLSIAQEVQSVAGSVSMVSGGRLEAQQLAQLSDYAAYLPGLNLDTGGVPSQIIVQLRGIAAYSNSPTVAFSIDDAPIGLSGDLAAMQAAPDLIPYDLERIEVRRGPQGTLGGAGSEAGLIKYVLNEPSISGFEARVGTGVSATHYASKPGASLQAMVNVPVVENALAVRVSGYDTYRPGFIDNVYSGAQEVNVFRRYGGRITTLWLPTAALSVKVTALWNRIDAYSSDLALSTGVATAVDAGDANIFKASNSWGKLHQDSAFLPAFQANLDLYAATLHWDPGAVEVVSVTTWSRSHRLQAYDTTPETDFPLLSGGTIPAGLSTLRQDTDLEKFSDELRIVSPQGRRIEWLLGGFFTHERVTDRIAQYAFDTSYQPISQWTPALWFQVVPSTFEKWALFGDLTWRVTDHLDVTGGIRYDHNFQAFSALVGGTIMEPATNFGRYVEGVTSWAATARYHFTPDLMLYGTMATGLLPGNTNGIGFPPVQAESVTNHEAGLKSEFLERKATIDLSVFYIDWKDIQIFNRDGFFLVNGGTAVSQGAELASSWSPLEALRFGYNATYTRVEFTDLVPAARYYLTGYQLPQVPELSMSFTGDYDWALTELWHAHAGGAWRWIGALWSLAVESRSLGGAPTMQLPAYSVFDLNASIAKGALTLRAFAQNLADTRASMHGHIATDPTGATHTEDFLVQPRTIGVGIDYTF
jgi:iron complex outermembrane recepter protein